MIALKTLIWTLLVPGMVTVILPHGILTAAGVSLDWTDWPYLAPAALLAASGILLYLWCAWNFGRIGKGTPAPFDPPKRVVARGPYRFVRNPMYVAISLILAGEVLGSRSEALLIYLLAVLGGFHFWVLWYEEPTMKRKFGVSYTQYCDRVRRWIPRLPPQEIG